MEEQLRITKEQYERYTYEIEVNKPKFIVETSLTIIIRSTIVVSNFEISFDIRNKRGKAEIRDIEIKTPNIIEDDTIAYYLFSRNKFEVAWKDKQVNIHSDFSKYNLIHQMNKLGLIPFEVGRIKSMKAEALLITEFLRKCRLEIFYNSPRTGMGSDTYIFHVNGNNVRLLREETERFTFSYELNSEE